MARSAVRSEGLGASLVYPLRDGPGVAMLVLVPPFLWFMSIPVLDLIAALAPSGEFNALALLMVPFTLPLVSSFILLLGYVLLFLGQVLVSSALGDVDHPTWPEWVPERMTDGVGRLILGTLVGVLLGALPAGLYWFFGKPVDFPSLILLATLIVAGVVYSQLAMAAALLHDRPAEAHPGTVLRAMYRMGWSYLYPSIVTLVALSIAAALLWWVLFDAPSLNIAALGLWAFWVLAVYLAMVCARVLGLAYARHAEDLRWCRNRPQWTWSRHTGRIYGNS
jgi:hypothetical protein